MTIYIVSMSTTQGPYGPTVNMTYHRDHQDALDEFTECKKSLSEDPSTILLVKVDGETMENTILNSFEGTDEDYMDEYGEDLEDEEDEEG
jgi:hypothetical protein